MPVCNTKYFGHLEYVESSALEFPRGLPGFEQERQFVVIEHPTTRPLVYLQSLGNPQLCFVAVPVNLLAPEYQLELSEEDSRFIGRSTSTNVLCLAIVSIRETGATANLMAPVVASLASRKAIQAIAASGKYSHQHPLSA
jgi:flagellar assembly factor FliW